MTPETLQPVANADRQLLELHALRQRQLSTAFLHGRRRSWRQRRRVWPAVVIALVLIALLVAGASVVDAFHRQQESQVSAPPRGGNSAQASTASVGAVHQRDGIGSIWLSK